MKEQKIKANGLDFNVLIEGTGTPVLLLHGFPDSAKLWKHVMPYLVSAGYKVIAPDQRGYGETDAPEGVAFYETSSIVADAVAILKELGYESGVRLVGHDWGALIGWLLCLQHPEIFQRYAAVSVGHPLAYRFAGLEQKLKAWYVLAFQIPGFAEWMLSANKYARLRKMAGSAEERQQRVQEFSRPGRLSAALNWYRANFSQLGFARFEKSKVPTLGVYSAGDIALTEKQMLDSEKYMDAEWRYRRIEGTSSHWIPLDQPEELARLICEWFAL